MRPRKKTSPVGLSPEYVAGAFLFCAFSFLFAQSCMAQAPYRYSEQRFGLAIDKGMGTGSPCYERPQNEEELKLEIGLCQAEPAYSVERKPGGRCVNPHIETDRERQERESRCSDERFERFERARKQFEIPLPPHPPGDEAEEREFLINAGVDPKVADIIAQFDRGYAPGPAMAAMQEASGASKEAFYNFLNSLKSEEDLDKFRKFVKLARRITADRQGVFTRSAEVDADLNALLKLGHELFGDRFPAPERIPDSPPPPPPLKTATWAAWWEAIAYGGFDPKVAELLVERDSNGYGSSPAIVAMVTASGANKRGLV